jgi:N-acetylmuramoyl-L-alanine amidase
MRWSEGIARRAATSVRRLLTHPRRDGDEARKPWMGRELCCSRSHPPRRRDLGRLCSRRRGVRKFAIAAAALTWAAASLPCPAQAPAVHPSAAPAAPAAPFVVVLDAAHGGDDTGGHSGNWTEKAYTLALSVRLRGLLMARGMHVVTTREGDVTLDAEQRDAIANHAQAQACLSLHATLSGNGVHLFVSSLAPMQPAHLVPWRTAQAASVGRSLGLAGVLNSALAQAGVGVTLGRTSLRVVDSMTCPAVAVEIAPSASAGQTATDSLNDAGYQAKVADALAAALVEWQAGAQRTEAREP